MNYDDREVHGFQLLARVKGYIEKYRCFGIMEIIEGRSGRFFLKSQRIVEAFPTGVIHHKDQLQGPQRDLATLIKAC